MPAANTSCDPVQARVVETMGKALDEVSAERDRLAARLAEVEAERDTAAERWINTAKALADAQTERDGLLMQNDLGGERLREMAAERDRLVQELEKALGHLRAVMNAERQAPPHRPQEDDEALAFLARFPREGDEG